MATLANIFTLKLENKDFDAQLQTAAKTSQDYNNKIANSLLEAAKLQTKLIALTTEKADAQLRGDKATIKSINQQIAATKTLIQVENGRIKESTNRINIEVDNAQKIIAMDKAEITTKESLSSAIKRRNDVLSSLSSQRIAEEKARYLTLSSLAAQKTKEASDNEIANTKRRNDVLSSLGSQRVAEEKARYLTLSSLAAQKTKESGVSGELRSGFESTYVNTSAQNKYNTSLAELNTLKSQGVISEGEYTKALKKSNEALKQGAPERDNQFNHMIRMMRWAGTLAAAFYGVKTAWDATLGTGLEVTAQFEQMQIGISALIATNSQNVTAMGKHVTASQKFAMAQRDAAEAIIMLRKANIDTPATLEQLTRGFQSALGPAMSLGFNLKQTVEYSKLMTLAASALTVPMEQLAQETRSILNGTIDQNSIVAVSLGITNAQIKAHKEQGDVYEFLIGKLSDFNAAGQAVNQSWAGIASNLSDSWRAFTSDVTVSTGLFAGLKTVMGEFTTVLKNQNGELTTLSNTLTNAGIIAGTFYGVTLLGTGVSALRAIILETKAATTAQTLLNLATKANPWVLLATAIAGATFALLEYKDLADQISASTAKGEGANAFTKDLQFIAGKDKKQQVHDLVSKSKELREEQIKLIAVYDKGIFFSLKEKDATKARIDAITEHQNAIKKYLAIPGARTTIATDTLISKPKEKTAEELAKEQREAAKLLRNAQVQATKAYMIERNKLEAQLAKEDMDTAKRSLKGHEAEIEQLKIKEATRFQLQANAEKALTEELALIAKADTQEGEKESARAKAQREYYDISKSFYTWVGNAIETQADKEAKQSTALEKSMLKDYETRMKLRALEDSRIRESSSFEQVFGTGKISPDTAGSLIRKEKLDFNWTKQGLFGDELDKAQADFDTRIEHIKNKIAEVPPLEINVKVKGWDDASNNIASLVNAFTNLRTVSTKYEEYSKITATNNAFRSSKAKSAVKEQTAIENASAQEKMGIYSDLAGAFAGLMKENSKEQKAAQAVQMGLNATMTISNAYRAISGAAIGVGPTGLITAAAMVAFLTSMGIFKGSGSASYDANAALTANEGKGSVLGDVNAQSESISKALEIMGDLAKPEFALISQMNKSLISIDQKIGGLSANIVQQGGFAVGEGYVGNSSTVTMVALFDKWREQTTGYLDNALGDKFGIASTIYNAGASIIGAIAKGVFGGGSSTSLQDAGISFSNQFLDAAILGLQGKSYQITKTVTDGGWFRGDKTSYNSYFSQLDEYTKTQFQLVLGSLKDTTLLAGQALDTSAADVEASLASYVVALGKISLKGKTGEEIQTTLTSVFGKIGDEIAAKAFPALIPFQAIGEGLYETMTRVATGMEEADYYISRLGQSFQDIKYTDLTNTQGDVALETLRQSILNLEGTSNGVSEIIQTLNGTAENLFSTYSSLTSLRIVLDAIGKSTESLTSEMLYGAGGIEALQTATTDYIDIFLSQSEQLAYNSNIMKSEFQKLNLIMPSSNEAFRAMIDGIDTSTASGQELFGRLILLSKGFGDLTSSVTSSLSDITSEAQNLADAFTAMANSIQETIDKLMTTDSGTSQATMIGSFWEKRAQADLLLAKRGNLTVKEQGTLSGLVSELDSLALSIQGAQIGSTSGITASLVGQLQDLKSNVVLDSMIVQSRILDANGATVNVATEGTLTRLTNAIIDRNALLGIDGSHANGLTSVPYDGYIAELHKGERVLTASEANSFGGRSIINFNTSALEAINNKMYDRINQIYGILSDAQLGARPLYIRAN